MNKQIFNPLVKALIDLGANSLETTASIDRLTTVSDISEIKAEWCKANYIELYEICLIDGVFHESIFNENTAQLDEFLSENQSDFSNGPGIEE